ncbi:putative phosphoribosyltransferase [Rhodococcus opacus M213]|uniref:Putative phosphoribosyltransferase n=1 Tax=Rhodococcus opacus M213 TaxID=1129896 RepID=K8XHU0_RHOOP|nr:phosphoribosyltransferase family protein [Rhodococcus opacus]EKT76670.1 putative phosphoribosyltransferase [Rhodococcus opacus M213]UOT07291.1 phosphoribosyltransferase family protein [Rhodococcus opacus]
MPFLDRRDAGRRLAGRLQAFRDENTVVLGLPRGGVPVAYEVARALDAPLDVIVVRKLGVPYQPEFAFGAIGEDGVRVLNDDVVRMAHVTAEELTMVERTQRAELQRRSARFRRARPRVPLTGRTAVIIDDGMATGATARAGCQVARAHGAARVVLAVPVGSREAIHDLAGEADEVISLEAPTWFDAVGQWYVHFGQTSDDEVCDLLRRAAERVPEPVPPPAADPLLRDEEVTVRAGQVSLTGHLTVPENPVGIVVFAHGSGSSRHSPRNRYVASVLNRAGLGTLLFDLLTAEEETQRARVFDIGLLAQRLVAVTRWLGTQAEVNDLRIGYFGASTGAGAALRAATDPQVDVAAVVSRGGRPDLAGDELAAVRAPTLLIVGGSDDVVLELNRRAQAALTCESALAVVPGATHLFEEPGTLEQVAVLARDWFAEHLAPTRSDEQTGTGTR